MNLIALIISTFTMNAFADTSEKCPGEEGYYYTNYRITRNPVTGGFVAHTATIGDNTRIVIGRNAAVCGYAMIFDSAQVNGNAIVRGNAQIKDSSFITGDVIIEGNTEVSGSSVISGTGKISSGTYHDYKKNIEAPVQLTLAIASPTSIAEKLQNLVKNNASKLTPPDGGAYHGNVTLEQKLLFTDGPCELTIRKKRTGCDSYFCTESDTSINLKNATDILRRYYSPSLVTANIQVVDKDDEKRVERRDWDIDGHMIRKWANQFIDYNDYTAESLEFGNKADADLAVKLLKDLTAACK